MLQLLNCNSPAMVLQRCLCSFCRYPSSPLTPVVHGPLTFLQLICLASFATPESWESKSVDFFFSQVTSQASVLLLRKSVFQFSMARAAATRELPNTPHLCRRQHLFQYCPWWICPLEWRPLNEGRSENPQDATHPFAEVAAHFWKQYSHVCSQLSLSWWTWLGNRSWNLVDAEGGAFSVWRL